MSSKKAVLIVIDGWGIAKVPNSEGDAITAADTPVIDSLTHAGGGKYCDGYTELEASSEAVGLNHGLMGNSEVGHLNIGAGRVVWQDVVRIDKHVRENDIPNIPNIKVSFEHAASTSKRLHLLGLVSDGGVHSHITHLFALLDAAVNDYKIPEIYVHFFGDGRDTDPHSGVKYLQQLLDKMKQLGDSVKLGTIVGRYYAMDRDKRWERLEIALKGLVLGEGEATDDPVKTVEERYEKKETDEFLKPIIVNGDQARIKDKDTLFFFNYRSDRVREITQLLGVDNSPLPDFPYPKDINITTMTQYKTDYPFNIAFPPQKMDDVLAEWLSKKGKTQVHIAETEKYAHVTFFFAGGVEKQFKNEDRDLISSPKVATYDLQPEMSVQAVADKVAERMAEGKHDVIVCNFAPPDMVGHTGVFDAAVIACTATDKAVGTVLKGAKESGYIFFLTADHGNAEEMLNEEGKPKTAHTTNKVPFILANAPDGYGLKKEDGVLGDVAPTILDVLDLEIPEHMTGHSLLIRK